jgi:hypothetical protein
MIHTAAGLLLWHEEMMYFVTQVFFCFDDPDLPFLVPPLD